MSHCSVFYCLLLLLSIVATGLAETECAECVQRDTDECDKTVITAACSLLNKSGRAVPNSCIQPIQKPTNRSCDGIHQNYPSAPSGNYQIQLLNCSKLDVYCNMGGDNCGGEGGWTRVAFVNITEDGAECPTRMTRIEVSNRRLCVQSNDGCQTVGGIDTHGLSYRHVCGQLRGYQGGYPYGFYYTLDGYTIDETYVDGASITYGSNPRKHIWTYAAGREDEGLDNYNCPCNTGGKAGSVASVVGTNYFCESGSNEMDGEKFNINDPLWDGSQCAGTEMDCCDGSNMGWFNTTLTGPTTDTIELRMCSYSLPTITAFDLIELYIR